MSERADSLRAPSYRRHKPSHFDLEKILCRGILFSACSVVKTRRSGTDLAGPVLLSALQ